MFVFNHVDLALEDSDVFVTSTDVYGLGVVLYTALTAAFPFDEEDDAALMDAILTQLPMPPSMVRPELNIPAALDAIVLKAMAKRPEERFESSSALRRALLNLDNDTSLSDANLRAATLRDAVLIGADLSGADLRGANLRGANFSGANLRGALLDGANMREANLTSADMTDASAGDADVRDVLWLNTTCPDGTISTFNDNTCEGHLNP